MIDKEQLDLVARLIVAVLLGAAVGIERERIHRAAGLKTHVLVSVGSALFTVVSIEGFFAVGRVNDPARVAAQIVSGIGFLGAGTIMKQGITVRGLTTAASLWVVAGIGMAAGAGMYTAAVATTFLVAVSMFVFRQIERPIRDKEFSRIEVHLENKPGHVDVVRELLAHHGVLIKNLEMDIDSKTLILRMIVQVPTRLDRGILLSKLHEAGVEHVEW